MVIKWKKQTFSSFRMS